MQAARISGRFERVSATNQSAPLLSEAALFRKLDLDPRTGRGLRTAGIIVPAETVGNRCLYREEQIAHFKAKLAAPAK